MKGRLTTLLAAALLSASCIYDFNAELDQEVSDVIVVEGDIIVGGTTNIACSYLSPAGSLQSSPVNFKAIVESSDGRTFASSEETEKSSTSIDTRDASGQASYRLLLTDKNTGLEYQTPWLEVHKAPVIDSLSSKRNVEKDRLEIGISAHSDSESYFKWRFEETWEYHAYYYAYLKYLTPSEDYPYGRVVDYEDDDINFYYCWDHARSTDVRLFDTASQTEDTFVDLEFHTIARNDERLSILYLCKVYIEALSEQAYRFWTAIDSWSDSTGDLFSPIPSEISGNISCTSDSSAKAIGYISASTESSIEKYFDESKFYREKNERPGEEPSFYIEQSWPSLYRKNYLPVFRDDPDNPDGNPLWTEARCVDCTLKGGTKEKPQGWPNLHR